MSLHDQAATVDRSTRWGAVPYITAWSSEDTSPSRVVVRGGRVAYSDESLYDRDAAGVLWARMGFSPGVGVPQFKSVHFLRQRRAMRRLLCQVCGQRAGDDAVWMLSVREYEGADGTWPAPITTTHPPLCPSCVERSVRLCPHLRGGHVVLRARKVAPVAVSGLVYRPTPAGLESTPMIVALDDPLVRWVRATQLHMLLDDYTLIQPDTLA
ncbi:hypothetical protein [Actinomadura flavalba]|uniref:hypothetical protein n=1 Tax=Actinomadura flavalba TaxID=1120938 RepID=UPI00068570C2|nr:hypothetical protein [Actinomadura flavalba]